MNDTNWIKELVSDIVIIASVKHSKLIKNDPSYSGIPIRIKKYSRQVYILDKTKFRFKLPKNYFNL